MEKNNEQIILSLHLKSEEDLNEKIIKEKGNTKCIFYADDICRNGDKTRDCVNCARVEYHSLYSLNWDNQERLQKIIKHKEQECKELKKEKAEILEKTGMIETLQGYTVKDIEYMEQQLDQLKKENEELKQFLSEEPLALQALQTGYADYKKRSEVFFEMINQYKQTLEEIREIAKEIFKTKDWVCGAYAANGAKQILQKINEVIDGN